MHIAFEYNIAQSGNSGSLLHVDIFYRLSMEVWTPHHQFAREGYVGPALGPEDVPASDCVADVCRPGRQPGPAKLREWTMWAVQTLYIYARLVGRQSPGTGFHSRTPSAAQPPFTCDRTYAPGTARVPRQGKDGPNTRRSTCVRTQKLTARMCRGLTKALLTVVSQPSRPYPPGLFQPSSAPSAQDLSLEPGQRPSPVLEPPRRWPTARGVSGSARRGATCRARAPPAAQTLFDADLRIPTLFLADEHSPLLHSHRPCLRQPLGPRRTT